MTVVLLGEHVGKGILRSITDLSNPVYLFFFESGVTQWAFRMPLQMVVILRSRSGTP